MPHASLSPAVPFSSVGVHVEVIPGTSCTPPVILPRLDPHEDFSALPPWLQPHRVEDDDMNPEFRSGEMVLVDHVRGFGMDGIYLVRLYGAETIRRVQALPGRKFRVFADRRNFVSPLFFSIDGDPDFEIIGPVIWQIKRRY